MSPDDPRHGTANGYYNLGCRCIACADAANAMVWRRKSLRGRLRMHGPNRPHGTRSTYVWGCRCELCRTAEREYRAQYRERNRARQVAS